MNIGKRHVLTDVIGFLSHWEIGQRIPISSTTTLASEMDALVSKRLLWFTSIFTPCPLKLCIYVYAKAPIRAATSDIRGTATFPSVLRSWNKLIMLLPSVSNSYMTIVSLHGIFHPGAFQAGFHVTCHIDLPLKCSHSEGAMQWPQGVVLKWKSIQCRVLLPALIFTWYLEENETVIQLLNCVMLYLEGKIPSKMIWSKVPWS